MGSNLVPVGMGAGSNPWVSPPVKFVGGVDAAPIFQNLYYVSE